MLDPDELNVLGSDLTIVGDTLLAQSAELQYIINKEGANNNLQIQSNYLNILGNWVVLISDIILAIAAQVEADKSDEPYSKATINNLRSSWLTVIADIYAVEASIESVEENS